MQSEVPLLQAEVKAKTEMIEQLEDKLTESRKDAERNRVNLFNANKHIHNLQSDMEQLRLTVIKIKSDFDAQSTCLNSKLLSCPLLWMLHMMTAINCTTE